MQSCFVDTVKIDTSRTIWEFRELNSRLILWKRSSVLLSVAHPVDALTGVPTNNTNSGHVQITLITPRLLRNLRSLSRNFVETENRSPLGTRHVRLRDRTYTCFCAPQMKCFSGHFCRVPWRSNFRASCNLAHHFRSANQSTEKAK